MKIGNLVPAFFFGSPVTLLLSGLLGRVMPTAAALIVGVIVGTLAGRALLRAI